MTTSAPFPPVSPRMASTTSAAPALTRSVAPSARADSSFRPSRSTAMIRLAPSSAEPAIAAAPVPGVDRGAEPGHDAAAQQADSSRARFWVDLRALARCHEGLFGEGTDAEGRRQLGPVLESHSLRRVVRREAVPGLAPGAG